jgi:predicted short-subunit dehydrogenase-like oxidoreductase (DUF2520 family)
LSANSEIGEIKSAVILGAGNVAWHLGTTLSLSGITITQIYNRSVSQGKELADFLKTGFTDRPENINRNADLIVLAVSDDVIVNVAGSLGFLNAGILVHTAGSVSIKVLSPYAKYYGVIYPLQTFSRERSIDFKKIPLLLEANSSEVLTRIRNVASNLSEIICNMDSEDRKILHLSAVLSSNFSNHLILMAERIMADHKISFDLLRPLMKETVARAFDIGPSRSQTGPAIRGNMNVIREHLKILEPYPQVKAIYKLLSDSIMNDE